MIKSMREKFDKIHNLIQNNKIAVNQLDGMQFLITNELLEELGTNMNAVYENIRDINLAFGMKWANLHRYSNKDTVYITLDKNGMVFLILLNNDLTGFEKQIMCKYIHRDMSPIYLARIRAVWNFYNDFNDTQPIYTEYIETQNKFTGRLESMFTTDQIKNIIFKVIETLTGMEMSKLVDICGLPKNEPLMDHATHWFVQIMTDTLNDLMTASSVDGNSIHDNMVDVIMKHKPEMEQYQQPFERSITNGIADNTHYIICYQDVQIRDDSSDLNPNWTYVNAQFFNCGDNQLKEDKENG